MPLDERHLVVPRDARRLRAHGRASRPASGCTATTSSRTPAASARRRPRSSPASALARALVAGGSLLMDDDAVFALAADLEGHPDNVAPALLRRLHDRRPRRRPVLRRPRSRSTRGSRRWSFVPPTPVSTEVARGLLPDDVPHADAAANAGRAALLVAALAGQPELLLAATEDRLHQDYRRAGDAGRRSRWSTRCAPTASPRWSPAPARPCWCSPTAASSGRSPACPRGLAALAVPIDADGARVDLPE